MAESPENQMLLKWAKVNIDEVVIEFINSDERLKKAMEELEKLAIDNNQIKMSLAREKTLRDLISFSVEKYRKGYIEGLKQSIKDRIIKLYKNKLDKKEIAKILEIDIKFVEKVIEENK